MGQRKARSEKKRTGVCKEPVTQSHTLPQSKKARKTYRIKKEEKTRGKT